MELQWYDIRQLDDGEARRVTAMMDETRRRRVADIAGEDDRKRTVAGELLARRRAAGDLRIFEEVRFYDPSRHHRLRQDRTAAPSS